MAFPTLLERAKLYVKSRAVWTAAGKPMRSTERILEIYTKYCEPCEHYKSTGFACDICGCFINQGTLANKIAWSTTRCPDIEPKWVEDVDIVGLAVEENIVVKLDEEIAGELNTLPTPEQPATASPEPTIKPATGGCGCG